MKIYRECHRFETVVKLNSGTLYGVLHGVLSAMKQTESVESKTFSTAMEHFLHDVSTTKNETD